VVFKKTVVMINRDWFRNVWHRVANDIYPAYVAMEKFGLLGRDDLELVHVDWHPKETFLDIYDMVSKKYTWLKNLNETDNIVCFDDVIFMVSRHWHSTFPENPPQKVPINPTVLDFGKWVVDRLDLGNVRSSFVNSQGKDITISWISRNAANKGNRAFKNEDVVIEELSAQLGPNVMIQKLVFEEMSWKEQVMAARGSDILFGMHGAGFTHILWLPAHAVVVEILPMDFHYLFYERVAGVCGRRYISWQNDNRTDMVEWTWMPHTKFTNLYLKTEKILPKLKQAIAMIKGVAVKEEL
jgi:hypothetical protein